MQSADHVTVRSTSKAKYRQRQSKMSMTKKSRPSDRVKLLYAFISADRTHRPRSRWEEAERIKKRIDR